MDKTVMKEIAEDAANKAVHGTLISLGIDVHSPIEAQKDMAALRDLRELVEDEEFKKDLLHLRRWRKTMDSVENKGIIAALGLAILGVVGFAVYALRLKFFS